MKEMDTRAFEEKYKSLTPAQKQAVDTVEGPVLVVAGPGTGKTHVLTLRIANILLKTQAKPEQILALTFTDSATRTLRTRLAEIIGGPTAREVGIYTFHGFCGAILEKYPEYFPGHENARQLGDVEQTLLFCRAIDETESKTLRPVKSPYFYLKDLIRLYETLTREGMSLFEYRQWAQDEKKALLSDEEFQYKKGDKKGELTKAGEERMLRFEKVEEAANIIEAYKILKDELEVYDFSDILRMVLETIASNTTLRAELQETYQYVLADEHQDANALQHRLLELLAYDNHPNLFVVGDEKQAIYRFQGADSSQFATLTDLFPRMLVITLSESFRSYQHVLDTAHALIKSTGTHKELAASRGGKGESVFRVEATDPLGEQSRIAHAVGQLVKEGIAPHEIAVITRKNGVADTMAHALAASGLPVLRAGDISLFSRPLVHALLSFVTYCADPLRVDALRRALLAPWWNIDPESLARILRQSYDSELLASLESSKTDLSEKIAQCLEKSRALTPLESFSYIFSESGARDYFLSHAEHFDDITLIRRFMMHLEEASRLNPNALLTEVMEIVLQAEEHDMSVVKTTTLAREGFITVITAHKAKGMEFEHVFIPDCTESGWEKGGRPGTIPTPFENKQSFEDAQRLFYVALTRAKDRAYLCYANENANGRVTPASRLVDLDLPLFDTESELLPVMHTTVDAPARVTELVRAYLTEQGLSPSALCEYLESPAMFFCKRVLRMNEPQTPALILGIGVHAGLARLLSGGTNEEAHGALRCVFRDSLLLRNNNFESLEKEAHANLDAFINENPLVGEPILIEKKLETIHTIAGTPVRIGGKVDAVFKTENGTLLVDFKTGSNVSAKDEKYVLQLALYAHLLKENEYENITAELVSLSKGEIEEHPVILTSEIETKTLQELDAACTELLSGKWREGNPSDYDAVLELFASS